ncbi:MAG: tetratricopeptide repeat protein [Muribaculaceae bacterium]|nr:tetratricopeptide repeat protein [Muribaculaceae bacterium]
MANNKNTAPETQNAIDNLNDNLTDLSIKVQNNKKGLIAGLVVIILVIVGILLFNSYSSSKAEKADVAVGKADISLFTGNDSLALAQYKQTAELGHDAGNRASLNAAIMLYQDKQYDEAIKYIDKYSPKEALVGAAALSLKGDCYVNTDNLPEAVKAFKAAIKQSDNNPYYTPFFMLKLARVYRAQQDYAAEAKLYEEIQKNYPQYAAANGINIEKYLERARLDANK